jgi:hypothetical protein
VGEKDDDVKAQLTKYVSSEKSVPGIPNETLELTGSALTRGVGLDERKTDE